MILKIVFIFLILIFCILSYFIDLPPGILIDGLIEFSFPYSTIITNQIFNGFFFATIIGFAIYFLRNRKRKSHRYNGNISGLDYQLKSLLDKQVKFVKNSNLTKIKGIGSKRAMELELAGVKTIGDLATRSPQNLSEKTGIPITLITDWILRANKKIK